MMLAPGVDGDLEVSPHFPDEYLGLNLCYRKV